MNEEKNQKVRSYGFSKASVSEIAFSLIDLEQLEEPWTRGTDSFTLVLLSIHDFYYQSLLSSTTSNHHSIAEYILQRHYFMELFWN